MTMLKHLGAVVALVCLSAAACGDNPDAPARLKVDLDAVVAAGQVSPIDGLSAAGQPDEAAFRVFAESGYVAVLDLRTAGENRGLDEPAVVESLGMKYVALPISGSDITFDKARELAQLRAEFDGPVLVHCASSNRVGALLALIEVEKGMDAEAAIDYGRSAGLRSLEGAVRKAIDER